MKRLAFVLAASMSLIGPAFAQQRGSGSNPAAPTQVDLDAFDRVRGHVFNVGEWGDLDGASVKQIDSERTPSRTVRTRTYSALEAEMYFYGGEAAPAVVRYRTGGILILKERHEAKRGGGEKVSQLLFVVDSEAMLKIAVSRIFQTDAAGNILAGDATISLPTSSAAVKNLWKEAAEEVLMTAPAVQI